MNYEYTSRKRNRNIQECQISKFSLFIPLITLLTFFYFGNNSKTHMFGSINIQSYKEYKQYYETSSRHFNDLKLYFWDEHKVKLNVRKGYSNKTLLIKIKHELQLFN